MSLKEGVSGSGGVGVKKEGKVKAFGHSLGEAVSMETAGLMGVEGQGKHSFKEGNHNKGGGKVCLRSDRLHPKKAMKLRRT